MTKITIVTHNGDFHTDDIFSVATLALMLGDNIEVRRSVLFNGQEISSYEDLQKVVKGTAKASKKEGKNLKYELTGARKQLSAQKRVERGDSEKWGAALEPAAFLVQDADGEFKEFTSYGKRDRTGK